MATYKRLVLHARDQPLTLETAPRPNAQPGQVVVRILAMDIVPYMSEVLSGTRPYPLSLPLTPGNTAIGRVFETGPDAVRLTPGQLVFCDNTIRGRDDPSATILYGMHGGGHAAAQKLMDGEWRHGTYAEYAVFPLENLHALDEEVLVGRLGYSLADLSVIPVCLVPFGGLMEVDVRPGEVVIVAPATGRYGGAAVAVALAMGATVVAAGRNTRALETLERVHGQGRLRTVVVTADAERNTARLRAAAGRQDGADVYLDLSPPAAQGTSLLVSGIGALRAGGRGVMMGGIPGKVEVPYMEVMLKSLRLQGRFMYDRQHVVRFVQMVESGVMPLGSRMGVHQAQEYGLESIDEALRAAAELSGWGEHVVLRP